MTPSGPNNYRFAAARTLRDEPRVRESVDSATRTFNEHRLRAYRGIDAEKWRDWARDVKSHALTHLDLYLEQAEERLVANGAHVHWATDASDALRILADIVATHEVRTVVKAKSMLTEELRVNQHLDGLGVQVRETDLGEYIIQLLGEHPSHIVGPAIHKSLDDCRRLFHQHLGTPLDAEPEALAGAARDTLRQQFLAADLGISGGNFLVAETGTLALIENEGNIRLSTSLPDVHIAFVGIEKIIPRLGDLSGFLQLTTRAATGQPIGNFVSLVQGPRRKDEIDGPGEVHVVMVDNGRTELLSDDTAWEALRCVRCGACLNICPVYRQTGGHPYGWTYSGPIGAIIAPGLLGLEGALPLPHASSLCGACAEVCPVRIPIPDLLHYWRERAVEKGLGSTTEKVGLEAYSRIAERPGAFEAAASLLRRTPWRALSPRLPVLNGWVQERQAPTPSRRSFRQLWRDGIK